MKPRTWQDNPSSTAVQMSRMPIWYCVKREEGAGFQLYCRCLPSKGPESFQGYEAPYQSTSNCNNLPLPMNSIQELILHIHISNVRFPQTEAESQATGNFRCLYPWCAVNMTCPFASQHSFRRKFGLYLSTCRRILTVVLSQCNMECNYTFKDAAPTLSHSSSCSVSAFFSSFKTPFLSAISTSRDDRTVFPGLAIPIDSSDGLLPAVIIAQNNLNYSRGNSCSLMLIELNRE